MYRRGFLSTVGSLAAIPAVGLAKAPQKNWHCLIGGNRCGKSTKAALMVSEYDLVVCVASCYEHVKKAQGRLIKVVKPDPRTKVTCIYTNPHMLYLSKKDLVKYYTELFADHKAKRVALWADECDPEKLHVIADLFDVAVFSSFPSDRYDIRGSKFFQECERMGTYEHMRMLPHIEEMHRKTNPVLRSDYWSDEEYARRVLGQFPS